MIVVLGAVKSRAHKEIQSKVGAVHNTARSRDLMASPAFTGEALAPHKAGGAGAHTY